MHGLVNPTTPPRVAVHKPIRMIATEKSLDWVSPGPGGPSLDLGTKISNNFSEQLLVGSTIFFIPIGRFKKFDCTLSCVFA